MCRRMVFVVFIIIAGHLPARAQTFSEWFAQKKTQKKYLALQIAKLQLYLSYVKNGYDIANAGLTTIGNIKGGDFRLHDLFFTDLTKAKPVIKDYSKTKQALTDAAAIRNIAGHIKSSLNKNDLYNPDEKGFINDQLNSMLSELLEDVLLLGNVTRSGELQMNDQQRLERIDKICLSVASKKQWLSRINRDYQLLYLQRQKNIANLDLLRDIY